MSFTGREHACIGAGISPWRKAMAEEVKEEAKKDFGPRKRLTKLQAVGLMVAGGVLLVLPWFFLGEQGSTLYMVKTVISVVGFVVLCLGSYYRP
jgi:hypothetical protein